MEVYNDVPVVLAEEQWEDIFLEEYNQEGLYVDYNDNGGNDRQLNAILMMYPYNKIGMKRIQNCIFAADRVNTFESQILEKKRTERIAEDICSKLSLYEPFYIYGAGKVGKGISKLWGRESKDYIKAFLVADVSRNVEEIDGISVVSYKECVGTSDKIVIALFNVNETEKVKKELLRCGIDETQIVQLSKKEKVALIKYSESII